MKRLIAITSASAVAIAISLAPADAKQKRYRHYGQNYSYGQGYAPYGWNGGWTSRNVGADPSFGNRAGIDYARRTGRCVEDLGYGRYEYCGW